MIQIYHYRHAKQCPYPWAEMEDGLPVHPAELQARVRKLIASNKPFATQSDIVIAMIGWMIRCKEIVEVKFIHVDETLDEFENCFDSKGFLLMPLPGDGFESIQEAGFYYRFSD